MKLHRIFHIHKENCLLKKESHSKIPLWVIQYGRGIKNSLTRKKAVNDSTQVQNICWDTRKRTEKEMGHSWKDSMTVFQCCIFSLKSKSTFSVELSMLCHTL